MKQGLIVIAAIVFLVLGVIAWILYDTGRVPLTEEPVAVEVAPAAVQPSEPEPKAEEFMVSEKRDVPVTELEEIPLPPLYQSDSYLEGKLADVVGEESVEQFFVTDALAARTVATVDALGGRQVPGNLRVMTGPAGEFKAMRDPDPPLEILDEAGDPLPQYLSSTANEERFLPFVELLESIDVEKAAAEYRRHYPLFQEAWREQGYTDSDFDQRLKAVIDELLATPEAAEPYRLVKPEAVYLFVDPELENLSGGQKILLRMGSDNAARVKSWLAKLRQAI
ncbi:MAG: DUF3014 domain-containing protein [Lysobacterales bacterium]|jgi:hypothetical protein